MYGVENIIHNFKQLWKSAFKLDGHYDYGRHGQEAQYGIPHNVVMKGEQALVETINGIIKAILVLQHFIIT